MPDGRNPIVVPRVYALKQTGTLRLDHAIRCYAGTGGTTMIALTGGPGSGKSTAIEYLRTTLPPRPVVSFFDEPHTQEARKAARRSLVIYSAPAKIDEFDDSVELRLAPWDTDEFIEYLLAANRTRVKSVMSRLEHDPHRRLIGGAPELWRPILDRMAADESIRDSLAALRRIVDDRMPPKRRTRQLIEGWIARCNDKDAWDWLNTLAKNMSSIRFRPPSELRHRAACLVLALDVLLRDLTLKRRPRAIEHALPGDLVQLCGRAAAQIGAVRTALIELLADARTKRHGTIASILHASGTGWEFPTGVVPNLSWADLPGAFFRNQKWPRFQVERAGLDGADFSGCELDESNFSETALRGARFRGARLRGATFWASSLQRSDLTDATLASASLRSDFQDADLSGALLTEACAYQCVFDGARFVRASFHGAEISGCPINDTDFAGADFSAARLSDLSLRLARLDGAKFRGARIIRSDLQAVDLPAAQFQDARFHEVDFSGSSFRRADFRSAKFESCGLAEIDWEGADLRNADLRGVTFHAGSSRSGLVGSPLACEGSRTGFYTDESGEQDFKSPEEIRKANLCGADLRGARIDDVDFYLVDLRGAHLDSSQIDWLRRCGAILESRA